MIDVFTTFLSNPKRKMVKKEGTAEIDVRGTPENDTWFVEGNLTLQASAKSQIVHSEVMDEDTLNKQTVWRYVHQEKLKPSRYAYLERTHAQTDIPKVE